jgi:hypothetical protein
MAICVSGCSSLSRLSVGAAFALSHRAKFWLTPVRLAHSGGFAAAELLRLERLVNERQSLLLGAWNDYFSVTE